MLKSFQIFLMSVKSDAGLDFLLILAVKSPVLLFIHVNPENNDKPVSHHVYKLGDDVQTDNFIG